MPLQTSLSGNNWGFPRYLYGRLTNKDNIGKVHLCQEDLIFSSAQIKGLYFYYVKRLQIVQKQPEALNSASEKLPLMTYS